MPAIYNEQFLADIKTSFARHIKPLLPGAALSGPFHGGLRSAFLACYDTMHRLWVYISPEMEHYFVFSRILPFTEEERSFLDHVMHKTHEGIIAGAGSIEEAMAKSVAQTVAEYVAPNFPETVARVIALYEAWGGENRGRISHTVGIASKRRKNIQGNFFEVSGKDLVKSLGASPNTLMVIDRAGGILGAETIFVPTLAGRGHELFSPDAYSDIALWTTSRRNVAVSLTEDGTILLFAKRRLLFAKRGSSWLSPPHTLINLASVLESIDGIEPETVKAVYFTALDMAGGNTPARIILVRSAGGKRLTSRLLKAGLPPASGTSSQNTKLLSVLVNGRKFPVIPRSVRKEIFSLGGTLFLDGQGGILGLDLAGRTPSAVLGTEQETKSTVFPGSAYMELFNGEGGVNVHLAIC